MEDPLIPPVSGTPAVPAVVPPPVAAVVPPIVPAPAPATAELAPATPNREAQLARELDVYRAREVQQDLMGRVTEYYQSLITQGWPEELAVVHAKTWGERAIAMYQKDQLQERAQALAKMEGARRLAAQFNLKPDELMAYNNADDMVAAASRLSGESKRILALEQRLAALQGLTAPAQGFDINRGSPAASDQAFLKDYSEGRSSDTARARRLLGM